jgi:hypothetical protein
MNPLDEQVKAMMAMLRAQGGVVGIDPNAPDFVKRAFIEMTMECPECRAAVLGEHDAHGN